MKRRREKGKTKGERGDRLLSLHREEREEEANDGGERGNGAEEIGQRERGKVSAAVDTELADVSAVDSAGGPRPACLSPPRVLMTG